MQTTLENQNLRWVDSRGFYLFYLILVLTFNIFLLSLPFIDTKLSWTITNITHNIAHLYFLHCIKGAPWLFNESGSIQRETHWEQLLRTGESDNFWTRPKKFLFFVPILLFIITQMYCKNSEAHFLLNFFSLVVVLLPKLKWFHHRRIFNINKY